MLRYGMQEIFRELFASSRIAELVKIQVDKIYVLYCNQILITIIKAKNVPSNASGDNYRTT